MRIGEIIERLNRKESLAVIAKQVGLTPYTLSRRLRLLGYEYDRTKKKRVFVGEGKEPLEQHLSNLLSYPHTQVDYQRLMYEELQQIRLLLTKPLSPPPIYQDVIKRRRTFSISEEVLAHLDERAKMTGKTKSQIVEEALKEWL
ncbi:ribbon-helix-helix domain-containing protein [Ectobacillus sp. JY-23]|uniref:ribbon-helix-helix domain-containing protein n=1 Tax=Ectobacillus sp. JY-23 TaxID=2933872 RepID=UPI001FF5CB72|nr:ribbon-helix-helix domain-containing protein [Ectobacillus sp. JY-23]UOY93881.1 ribbon-helix-helix domain-containing protein [Ectobacillus sp. JY-23]